MDYIKQKSGNTAKYVKNKYTNTFYNKNIISNQYPILSDYKINTFFDSIFLKKIQNVINNAEEKMVHTNIIKNNGNGKDKELQKKRIVNDYIIPLSYLIYSFIYTKYYNYQLKTQMMSENRLYYSMFGYVFKHNNPVIKKVNVNLYNYFKNENLSGTSKITLEIIITQKKSIATFLDSTVIPKMKDDNNYKLFEKYNIILDYFNKITLDIINIIKNLKNIITIIYKESSVTNNNLKYFKELDIDSIKSLNTDFLSTDITQYNTLYNKINNFYTIISTNKDSKSNEFNFINIFNKLSIEKQNNFNEYEEYYYKLLEIYKSILKKIELVNVQIVKLDNNDNLIYYDSINLFLIASLYKKYYEEYKNKNKEKEEIDKKIIIIKNIKLNIEQKIEIYEELFYNNKNINNSNKKIKNKLYLDKITKVNVKLDYNINNIIKDFDPQYNSIDNVNFNVLLNYFILSFKINEEIERNYIDVIFNINIKNGINIKKNIIDLQEYKIRFNNLFKDYKKLNKNSETKNLEKKEKENNIKLENIDILIKSSEKNIKSIAITSNINKLEQDIIDKNNELKNANKDLKELEIEKTKIEDIKKAIDIKKLININRSEIESTSKIEKSLSEITSKIKDLQTKIDKKKLDKKNIEEEISKLNKSFDNKKKEKKDELEESLTRKEENFRIIIEKIEEYTTDINNIKTEKNKYNKKIIENDDLIDDYGTKLKELKHKNYNTKLKNKIKQLEDEKTNLESEKTTLESEKTTLESKKTTLENEKTTLESEKTTLESEKNNLNTKDILGLTQIEKQKLIQDISDKNTRINKIIQDISDKNTRINKIIKDISKKTTEIDEITENISNKNTIIDKIKKDISEKTTKIDEITENIENLNNINKGLKTLINRLEDKIKTKESEKREYEKKVDIKKLEEEILTLKKDIKKLNSSLNIKKIIKNSIDNLEEEIKRIDKFINDKNIEIDKLNQDEENLKREQKRKQNIKNIDKSINNKNLNIINTIYNNIKKRGKKIDVTTLIDYNTYQGIEKYYLDKNPSNKTDFSSKNIYRRIFIIYNYYNNECNNKKKYITKIEEQLNNLKNNKNIKKTKEYILDIYNLIKQNLGNISLSIQEEKIKISSNSIDNKDLKDKINEKLNEIIVISKQYYIIIDNKNYDKVNNKILNYYNKNYIFIEIIKKIKSIITDNKNANKKITDELSDYFSSNDIFIDKLNPIFSNKFNDENVVLFFDQYQEFYNILKNKKIQLLLNKVNTGMIKYNNSNSHNDFINGIETKIEYYNKIIKSAEPSKNEFKDKKGKYTQVLPYTDIMFLYFIDLLIIIDYLTFYYE
jgi:DNA repair exonuclease SbcCD ATPase subunit